MKINASTKLRAIGGASVLALSAGLTGVAIAQSGPMPVMAAPTPTAPVAPGNAQECAVAGGVITCAPGTDADGFVDISDDPLGLDIQDGAVVQGPVFVTGAVDGAVDGSIQTGADFDGGLGVGPGSSVMIGSTGFIQTDGEFSVAVEAGDNSTLTNNGTIYTTGDNFSDAVSLGAGSDFTNNGLVQTDGAESFGIFGPGDGISVTNSETGSIITSGAGAFGVAVLDNATIINNGLIQTFGESSVGIDIGPSGEDQLISTVTNNGSVVTAGFESVGIAVRDNDVVVNNGAVTTAGDEAHGVVALVGSTITNNGDIVTGGDLANGIQSLSGANITNNDTITTGGIFAHGVFIGQDGVGDASTVTNDGTIQTSGEESFGIFVEQDGATITNTVDGVIETTGLAGFGIITIDNATILNAGMISTTGDFGIGIDVGVGGPVDGGSTVTNSGSISTQGEQAIGIGVRSNSTVNNSGSISTQGVEAHGVTAISNTTVINDGTISTAGDFANGVQGIADMIVTNNGTISTAGEEAIGVLLLGDNGTVTNAEGATISTTGLAGFGVVVLDNSTVVNAGTVSTTGLFGIGIDAQESATITNSGMVTTQGDFAIGIGVRSDSSVNNSGTIATQGDEADGVNMIIGSTLVNDGTISTAGDFANGVRGFADTTITNNGTISTAGEEAIGVLLLGDNGSVTNAEGATISTTGLAGFGVVVLDNSTVTNAGTIETADFFGIGIDTQEMGTVTNSGTVSTQGDFGIGIGVRNDSTVANSGSISTAGEEAFAIAGLNRVTIDNSGSITTAGDAASALRVFDDAVITNTGTITTSGGDDAYAVSAINGLSLTNSGTIAAEGQSRAINAGDNATITNEMGGLITTAGDEDTIQTGANLTIVNNGTISNTGFDTKIVDAGDGLTVTNNGVITSDWKGLEGEANFTLTNNEGARIFSTNDEAVEADGPGLVVINNGEIISPRDDAVDGGDQVTLTNTGLIQGGENDGMELNSGTITNSGIIESLSSDPNGDFSDAALTNRELDAGIDFDGGGDDADGLVTNLAGGIIRGDIGINASSGNFVDDGEGGSVAGSPANFGDQTVVNFGTIEGRIVNPVTGRNDAVLLSFGDDEFQQWTGAIVNGWVDLEAGDDTFILEGTASSISGGVQGGEGNDFAIIAGTLDADNIFGFETFQIGSDLGDTLNDAVISGNRTLDGDVVIVGEVSLGLGVDSLTSTGSMTLEEGSTITIDTPLDQALVGQTVTVLQEGTTFTDNGATINIIDDDLLVDYTAVVGSLAVQVSFVDPLANAVDPNVVAFGASLAAGVNAGTLSDGNFVLLNALPDAAAYQSLALDALPNLSNGSGREIFETSNLASEALNSHLASEGSGIWGQLAVRSADQDGQTLSSGGYESEQTVLTVGGDFMFGDHGRVGFLASYADIENDDLDGNGNERGETEIESIKLGAYVATTFDRLFINGELSYLTGDIDTTRVGALGAIGSSFDFDGFAYRGTVGYDILTDENISLTPSVGFNGANISFDDAVENGGFDFAIDREDADFFELRAGLEVAGDVSEKIGGFVRGTFVYETNDDARAFTLTSNQINTLVVTTPEVDAERFELAAGATVEVSDNFVIEVGYLGDYASGYDAHSARATARFRF